MMTHSDLISIMKETGLPFAYDHFAEGESPSPPFICFLLPGSNNFAADGEAFYKVAEVRVELYTDEKNPDLENTIETVFDNRDIFYDKSEVWIPGEKFYEILYSFEVDMDFRRDDTNLIFITDIEVSGPEGSETEDDDAE